MPNIGGQSYNLTDPLDRANGAEVNTSLRVYRNRFDMAAAGQGGGGTDPLLAAKVREGNVVQSIEIESDQNLSAINFSVGTEADPDKYGAAQAGPNAGRLVVAMPIAAAAQDELAAPEEIIVTPNAALPSSGTIVTRVITSKR